MGRRCSEICSTKAVRGFALTVNVDAINPLSEVEQLHHMSWCREVPTKRTLMVLSHITKTWGLTSSGLSFDSCQPTARLNAKCIQQSGCQPSMPTIPISRFFPNLRASVLRWATPHRESLTTETMQDTTMDENRRCLRSVVRSCCHSHSQHASRHSLLVVQ